MKAKFILHSCSNCALVKIECTILHILIKIYPDHTSIGSIYMNKQRKSFDILLQ